MSEYLEERHGFAGAPQCEVSRVPRGETSGEMTENTSGGLGGPAARPPMSLI
jgi:hypothetical protein